MDFSDLLLKIARGEKLAPQELANLRDQARAVDEVKNAVKSWLQPGSTNPFFQEIGARAGNFQISPINGIFFARTAPQSIGDNTETIVEFEGNTPASGFLSNTDTDGKVQVLRSHALMAVMGTVEWATNGTGRRGIHLNVYDSNDNLITGYTLHSLTPSGVAEDTLPFMGGAYFPDINDARYLRLTVIQTSGGALNLNGLRSWWFAVR